METRDGYSLFWVISGTHQRPCTWCTQTVSHPGRFLFTGYIHDQAETTQNHYSNCRDSLTLRRNDFLCCFPVPQFGSWSACKCCTSELALRRAQSVIGISAYNLFTKWPVHKWQCHNSSLIRRYFPVLTTRIIRLFITANSCWVAATTVFSSSTLTIFSPCSFSKET